MSDYVESVEVEELVSALGVSSGAECQRLRRLRLHGVVPVLVSVGVLSELEEAMLAELDRLASNYGLRD